MTVVNQVQSARCRYRPLLPTLHTHTHIDELAMLTMISFILFVFRFFSKKKRIFLYVFFYSAEIYFFSFTAAVDVVVVACFLFYFVVVVVAGAALSLVRFSSAVSVRRTQKRNAPPKMRHSAFLIAFNRRDGETR